MLKTKWEYENFKYQMRCFYENAGDTLHMHYHDFNTYHDILVLRGKIKVTGQIWSDVLVIESDQIVELTHEQYMNHEITALEDNTETLHVYIRHGPRFHTNLLRDKDKILY